MKKLFVASIILFCISITFLSCGIKKQTDQQKQKELTSSDSINTRPAKITDFEQPGNEINAPYGGDIYAFTDENENPKGTSTINEMVKMNDGTNLLNISFEKGMGAEKSDRFLKISGKVTTSCPFGFVGCGLNFKKNKEPMDISKFKGIKFWAKGSGDDFVVKIGSPLVKDYAYHECRFFADSDWEEFIIYFENFRQPSWKSLTVKLDNILKSATGLEWQTNSRPIKKYFLCLDNIEFIK